MRKITRIVAALAMCFICPISASFAEPPKLEISDVNRVFIRKINVEGSGVFSVERLAGITTPYENREITFEELEDLRNALTRLYVDEGYVNSGAVIPDQKVTDGEITIRIIEGRVDKIEIEGLRKLKKSYIEDRITLGGIRPLNVNELQKNLWLLQSNPLIKQINAELSPGVERGSGILTTRVEEENPFHMWLKLANNQSPSVGSERGEIRLSHENISGVGDTLDGTFGGTRGLYDFDVGYERPLTPRDTTIKFQARKNNATIVEKPFENLDIRSEAETYSIILNHPFFRTPGREFYMGMIGEKRYGRTYLLGTPYSFTEGKDGDADGRSNVTAMRFTQSFTDRSQSHVFSGRSSFNFGVDALGATINKAGPDGRFFSWLGQFQAAKKFGESGNQIIMRVDTQLAGNSLLPMERFPVGGMTSVRGYRENFMVRDNGLSASMEFRIPIAYGDSLQFAPFVDYGRSWHTSDAAPDIQDIYSVGPGLWWRPADNTNVQVYWGIPLKRVENTGHTLQEDGVHILITSQIF